jgi:hypothetical protein
MPPSLRLHTTHRRLRGTKNEPPGGMGASWRGSGHGYYFLLRKFCRGERRETARKESATFFSAQRVETATRALVKELLLLRRASIFRTPGAAFSILGRLEVTHVDFLFLLFAHITFLSCVFGFGLCSRRIIAVPLRPSRLGSGRPNGSAYLSNASAVELHAPQNLRPSFPSTNSHAPY